MRLAASNFVAKADQEVCTGCGTCIDYCQVDAMELINDSISINEQYCIGCGQCVSRCPVECLSLVRCADHEPWKGEYDISGLGV